MMGKLILITALAVGLTVQPVAAEDATVEDAFMSQACNRLWAASVVLATARHYGAPEAHLRAGLAQMEDDVQKELINTLITTAYDLPKIDPSEEDSIQEAAMMFADIVQLECYRVYS